MGRINSFIILAEKLVPVASPDINDCAVVVSNGIIKDITAKRTALKKNPGLPVVDMGRGVLLPGLVNLHSHLELSHLKDSIGEKKHLVDWITELVRQRRLSTKRKAVSAARDALRQAVRTGSTCLGDITGTGISLPLLKDSGLRAACFFELLGRDKATADRSFKALLAFLDASGRLPERIRLGISPHSAYSVSPSLFSNIRKFISSNRLPITAHLSESLDEMLYFAGKPSEMDRYMRQFGWKGLRPPNGKTPLNVFKGYGLERGLLAAHCVHVTASDMRLMKPSGVSVAYCPRSNAMLRVGYAPVKDMLKKGINVGLGTDSLASNISLDLWEEMRFAYLTSRLDARKIIEMATINGARALGFGSAAGSLEPGKDADIVCVDVKTTKGDDPCRTLVLNTRPEDVVFTMVQGRTLYSRDGRTPYEV